MIAAAGIALAAIGALYATAAAVLLWRWRELPGSAASGSAAPAWQPAVSVLKPLCGAEPSLHECLRSVFRQSYPALQIVFGVRDPADPALGVVAQLRREFPARDVVVVVDARLHGDNPKTSNMINMLPQARHPVVLISDSDVRVGDGWLDAVMQALAPDDVGAVTCLYRARPRAGLWARLAALFINDWYFPAVLVSHALGDRSFGSGVTIALRRRTIEVIGGLEAIADHLADDWLLCDRVRAAGLRTVLSRVVVETEVGEARFAVHAARELRWMRTIRTIAPAGYAFLGLSISLPVALAGVALAGASPPALAAGALALAARLAIHLEQRRRLGVSLRYDLPLIPLRDALLLAVWIAGFLGRSVSWRGRRYRVRSGGRLSPLDG
jgi:ceramide glucosyltransferase